MRTIKFRGKRLDSGKWIVGGLINTYRAPDMSVRAFIASPYTVGLSGDITKGNLNFMPIEVDPSTVGQFTGLLDMAAKEIYDGDIIRVVPESPLEPGTFEITYECGGLWGDNGFSANWISGYDCITHICEPDMSNAEVIGNIFDIRETPDDEK